MDNYSVEYPDVEETSSNDHYNLFPRLKPSKQLNETATMERTLNRVNINFKRSFGLSDEDTSPSPSKSPSKVGISKFNLSKRSGSTYESHFNPANEK